jgi:hypothetical protein
MKLTTRGWIVLVIVPVILATLLISYVTRDTCYVGLGVKGTTLGYGSCSKMIDNLPPVIHQTTTEILP